MEWLAKGFFRSKSINLRKLMRCGGANKYIIPKIKPQTMLHCCTHEYTKIAKVWNRMIVKLVYRNVKFLYIASDACWGVMICKSKMCVGWHSSGYHSSRLGE